MNTHAWTPIRGHVVDDDPWLAAASDVLRAAGHLVVTYHPNDAEQPPRAVCTRCDASWLLGVADFVLIWGQHCGPLRCPQCARPPRATPP